MADEVSETDEADKGTNLVIKSNIRHAVELSVAEEVEPALNKLVQEVLKKAEHRARANGRRTIQARDL